MFFHRIPPDPWLCGEPVGPVKGGVFIAWERDNHRSVMTARCFGLDLWMISPFAGQAYWRKLLRYLVSFAVTNWYLLTRRPSTVFVLNLPVPLTVSAAAYACVFGVPFIFDCHSGAYAPDRNTLSAGLYRWLTRKALFNINHNRQDSEAVEAVGGVSYLIPEIPGSIEIVDAATPDRAGDEPPNAFVVCSFKPDEPVELIFAAATRLPAIRFDLTGNYERLAPRLLAAKPANVNLLGFLAREDYLKRLASASVVVTLSKRSHIMQMAAEEALCLSVPLVSNRSGILEEVFGRAALFVELRPDSVARAIALTVKYNRRFVARMAARRAVRRDHLRTVLRAIEEVQFADGTRRSKSG